MHAARTLLQGVSAHRGGILVAGPDWKDVQSSGERSVKAAVPVDGDDVHANE